MSDPHPWGEPLDDDEPVNPRGQAVLDYLRPRAQQLKGNAQEWVTRNFHPNVIADDLRNWWRNGG